MSHFKLLPMKEHLLTIFQIEAVPPNLHTLDIFYDVKKKNVMHYRIGIYINDSSGFARVLLNLVIILFNVLVVLLMNWFYITAMPLGI